MGYSQFKRGLLGNKAELVCMDAGIQCPISFQSMSLLYAIRVTMNCTAFHLRSSCLAHTGYPNKPWRKLIARETLLTSVLFLDGARSRVTRSVIHLLLQGSSFLIFLNKPIHCLASCYDSPVFGENIIGSIGQPRNDWPCRNSE